jgi:putative transposase
MTTSRRRFAVQEKLSILEEAKKIGTMPAIRKHNLSYDVFLRWRNQFKKSAANPEVRALQLEIEKLKETIAQQVLKLKPKKEPPKKGGIENDKEEQLLRLVASLIVQTVLTKQEEDDQGCINISDNDNVNNEIVPPRKAAEKE